MRGDWKLAVKSTKITNTATARPIPSDWNISIIGGSWPMRLDPHAAGRRAGGVDGLRDLARGPAHVFTLDVRRQGQVALRRRAVELAGPHTPCEPSPRRGPSG